MFLFKRKAIFFVDLNMTMKYWTDFIRTFYSPFNRQFYFTPFSMFNINILRWLSITRGKINLRSWSLIFWSKFFLLFYEFVDFSKNKWMGLSTNLKTPMCLPSCKNCMFLTSTPVSDDKMSQEEQVNSSDERDFLR